MIPSHVGGLVIGGAAVTHNDDIVIAKRDVASAAACEQAVRTKVTVEYDDIGKFRAWAVVYKTPCRDLSEDNPAACSCP